MSNKKLVLVNFVTLKKTILVTLYHKKTEKSD